MSEPEAWLSRTRSVRRAAVGAPRPALTARTARYPKGGAKRQTGLHGLKGGCAYLSCSISRAKP